MSHMGKEKEQVGGQTLQRRMKNIPVLLGKGCTKLTAYLSYNVAILPCRYVCKRKTTKPYKYLLIIQTVQNLERALYSKWVNTDKTFAIVIKKCCLEKTSPS